MILEYPALYELADDISFRKQRLQVGLIVTEYALLFLAAVFSMSYFSGTLFYSVYAFIFLMLIGVLLSRAYFRPVQDWYRARALAESVKTLSWRYMMRAAPFDGAEAKREFASHLRSLLQANKDSAGRGVTGSAEGKQITDSMEIVRGLSLDERKEFYRQNRIFDQQRWYDAKAKDNRRGARFWTAAGVISYLAAGLLVLARIKFTEWGYWPIDPIIVFASSIIGWVQLKKYSELAAAYQVTGQEIGIIEAVLDEHDDEKTVADFVNDAELAFSREHTMWAARNNS